MEILYESHRGRNVKIQSEFVSIYQISRDFANILETHFNACNLWPISDSPCITHYIKKKGHIEFNKRNNMNSLKESYLNSKGNYLRKRKQKREGTTLVDTTG